MCSGQSGGRMPQLEHAFPASIRVTSLQDCLPPTCIVPLVTATTRGHCGRDSVQWQVHVRFRLTCTACFDRHASPCVLRPAADVTHRRETASRAECPQRAEAPREKTCPDRADASYSSRAALPSVPTAPQRPERFLDRPDALYDESTHQPQHSAAATDLAARTPAIEPCRTVEIDPQNSPEKPREQPRNALRQPQRETRRRVTYVLPIAKAQPVIEQCAIALNY
jgi:hypothetical protein